MELRERHNRASSHIMPNLNKYLFFQQQKKCAHSCIHMRTQLTAFTKTPRNGLQYNVTDTPNATKLPNCLMKRNIIF